MKTLFAYLVIAAVASASAAPETSFTFATWNVGHFSLGRYETSTIAADKVPQMLSAYSAFLDKADASIIGICEYSWFFDKESVRPAHDTVFARYPGSAKSQRQYDFNVLYWTNAQFVAENVVWFKHENAPRFYRHVKLSVAGHPVSFVETHLDWNTLDPGHENDRADQILQLIEDFKDDPLVVIAADFNTCVKVNGVWEDAPKEYEPFRKAGYAAAHMGELMTWPSDKPRMSIDNIFAKGLEISDVKVLADPALSDHALLRCRLTMSAAAATSVALFVPDGVKSARLAAEEFASIWEKIVNLAGTSMYCVKGERKFLGRDPKRGGEKCGETRRNGKIARFG